MTCAIEAPAAVRDREDVDRGVVISAIKKAERLDAVMRAEDDLQDAIREYNAIPDPESMAQ